MAATSMEFGLRSQTQNQRSTKETAKNLITLLYFPSLYLSHSSKSSFKNLEMKLDMTFIL